MAGRTPFRHECIEYVTVTYPMRISFPKDTAICDLCTFCHSENSGTRFRCTETGEILPYHNKGIGRRCPLCLDIIPNENQIDEEDVL